MYVIATAGHVDHGKSTLVRRLTGMEPDRWSEERRRGMTIDLGFAWTTMPDDCTLAFVDVPGHERFVPTMLAGIGPVPAVMFVVAADEGWMPQSQEHLDALAALGVEHGLLVITRSDLADPADAAHQARAQLRGTPLEHIPAVHVSGRTGDGVQELRKALDDLAHSLPSPELIADRRLWIDRAFTIQGAGTVVTGTLQAGRVDVGDELRLHSTGGLVTVRGLQCLGEQITGVSAIARVALNIRGASPARLRRGDALLDSARWLSSELVDVRLRGCEAVDLPRELMLHLGSSTTVARLRPLGGEFARLSLRSALPLRIGDRALLRDPGSHRIAAGVTVLDVRPRALDRRGAARARAYELALRGDQADGAEELRRRQLIRFDDLQAMGATAPPDALRAGPWLMDQSYRDELASRLIDLLEGHRRERPLDAGMPAEAVRRSLGLPSQETLQLVLRAQHAGHVTARGGRLRLGGPHFPDAVRRSLDAVLADLRARPFDAPTAQRLSELGLGERELAAAAEAGELLRLAPGLVLLPGAEHVAMEILGALPGPFTLSEVRKHLGTSRRVAVPLMELLARGGFTERLADGRHRVRP